MKYALCFLVFIFSSPVLAQGYCTENRDDIVKELYEKHGERPIGIGLNGAGAVMELFYSKKRLQSQNEFEQIISVDDDEIYTFTLFFR